ncbi:hypothetical protein EVAR_25986_1 [Eumeta japonica]|uniref:Uncharacterized protein n=1 Tax=Eumeta variegata TaxID=151549 RepID=A0A4C1V328_EUMVA|nr:hypothetical protein EVAR_25986_1 [Eumeta japonica]
MSSARVSRPVTLALVAVDVQRVAGRAAALVRAVVQLPAQLLTGAAGPAATCARRKQLPPRLRSFSVSPAAGNPPERGPTRKSRFIGGQRAVKVGSGPFCAPLFDTPPGNVIRVIYFWRRGGVSH